MCSISLNAPCFHRDDGMFEVGMNDESAQQEIIVILIKSSLVMLPANTSKPAL
jgi:hypothetical protein